ncbi:MAG: glucose 1-dehydrogenase [candidate division KSB1 bacterium]|nr:glucose 1-dehydrogenase [candidate division KSB1 bacterium]MDZ7335851.1 glucose 1-dehydrogenase [candidate division KSB1 bacterium]MDZ7358559.1 glucose 1-dehydrogenase [candidate division KSB1 bacterium]MDZ7400159.1 glucose 1-dehydrogenase [candidate division KSB1 bacterium]
MSQTLFDLTGKLALITGSGRGIGFTLAKGLAQAGCKIILNDIDKQRLDEAVSQLRSAGFNCHGVLFDVRDENSINEQVQHIEKEIGSIDILINNAGIQIRGPLEEFNSDDWRKLIDINLTGAFLVAKAVVQGMIKRRTGKIINICSIQSELARPTIAPYTAAKGGLRNLTKGMATDWGKFNIQINGIAPGYFKTEMTKALYEDPKFDAWLRSRVPANRWGEPEELIGAAIFLASKASDYVNGHILFVDGGLMACV